jgi:hypothetical protein
MTIKVMESELYVNWEMICQIILEHLGKKKIYRKFVPHSLRDELIRAMRVKCFLGNATW